MKKIKLIDKAIYNCTPEIGKKYANPLWWAVSSVIGIACLVVYLMVPAVNGNAVLGAIILTVAFCGLAVAVTMICYYLFGDCKKPYYRPNRTELSRYERYYDDSNAVKAGEYLLEGNFGAISRLPRAHQPLYLLVMYRSEGGEVLCAQMVDKSGVGERAMTEIEVFEKGAYDLPESLIGN